MLAEAVRELPSAGKRKVELDPTHTIVGSTSRFNTGLVGAATGEGVERKNEASG